jgi:hypothetical protein
MSLANVALTNTFDEWRIRTNQIIVSLDQNETITTAAFVKANVANSNFTASNILSRLITVDGSGSGLDADLLDGLNSTAFLRSDTSDSFDGGTIRFYTENDTGIEYIPPSQANGLQIFQGTSGNDAFMSFYINGEYGIHFGLDSDTQDLSVGGWSKGSNKYKVWHQGNDGVSSGLDADLLDGQQGTYYLAASSYTASDVLSKILTVDGTGSGLDADLLDGLNSSQFLRSDTSDVFNGLLQMYNDAGIDITNTGQINGLQVYQPTSGADALMTFQVAGDFAVHFGLSGDDNQLSVGGWSLGANKYKIWHEGNDGTGSGLDADLLDGQHGTAFVSAVSVVNPTSPSSGYQTLGSVSASIASGTLTITLNWVDIAEHPYVPPPPPPTPPPPPPMESAPPPPPMESAP